MVRKLLPALCALALSAAALPPPTQYTMGMLRQDLHDARLVALVRVLTIDTPAGTSGQSEIVTLGVDTCFKGGLVQGDTVMRAKRNTGMTGWYEPNYRLGERSFMCFSDTWKDGIHAFANTRAKFDITASDSVEPPPVGLGFSNEFAYYRTATAFAQLLVQTIRSEEFLHVAPLLPYAGTTVLLRTSINLSGGATLDRVTVTSVPGLNRIDMTLVYTPCTDLCPDLFLIKDTTVALTGLPAGDYTAYRTKENSLLDMIPLPDDTVQFTVYATSATLKGSPAARRPPAAGASRLVTADLRGRVVPAALPGPGATLLVADPLTRRLRPVTLGH